MSKSGARDDDDRITTIRVHESTKQRLEQFGSAGDTHEEVLNDVLDKIE